MSATLPWPVRRDLTMLVESEVFGERTYAICARRTQPGHRRDAYDALHDLERQTGALVRELVVGDLLQQPTANVARLVGTATAVPAGFGLLAMPWVIQQHMTLQTIRPYLATFRRLARHFARPGERTFYDYVLDHEVAIGELARRELAGRTDALDPVLALLGDDRWVPPSR